MRSQVRFTSKALVAGAVMALIALVLPVAPVTASPQSVDNVISTIGQRVQSARWQEVQMNIADLDRTIDAALNIERVPVSVATNPVADELASVTEWGKYVLDQKSILVDKLNKLEKAESNERPRALVAIFGKLFRELGRLLPPAARAPIVNPGTAKLNTDVLVDKLQSLRSMRARIALVKKEIRKYDKAIKEMKVARGKLRPLNAAMNAVLAKYGIVVGGPPVQPTPAPAAHPRIGGTWIEQSDSGCPGSQITYTQSANGDVTAARDSIINCKPDHDWVGENFRWTQTNVLSYDLYYPTANNFRAWHVVTFSADGTTGKIAWSDQSGGSGVVTIVRAG